MPSPPSAPPVTAGPDPSEAGRIRCGADLLVGTDDARRVAEDPHEVRYHVPADAVAPGVLRAPRQVPDHDGRGAATVRTVVAGGRTVADGAWSCAEPVPGRSARPQHDARGMPARGAGPVPVGAGDDLVRSYPDPTALPVAGHLAFGARRVDALVDGRPQPVPAAQRPPRHPVGDRVRRTADEGP